MSLYPVSPSDYNLAYNVLMALMTLGTSIVWAALGPPPVILWYFLVGIALVTVSAVGHQRHWNTLHRVSPWWATALTLSLALTGFTAYVWWDTGAVLSFWAFPFLVSIAWTGFWFWDLYLRPWLAPDTEVEDEKWMDRQFAEWMRNRSEREEVAMRRMRSEFDAALGELQSRVKDLEGGERD